MGRRAKLIFNPHADRGHAWDVAYSIRDLIRQQSDIEWATTDHPGHAIKLTQAAADEGFDLVVALGGDGTVHEMVNGLMTLPAERRPILGAIPIGSGNDFCANVGIAEDSEEAFMRLFNGEPKAIDIARVSDNLGRTEYWDNSLGIGFVASIAINAYEITRLRGFTMYLWAVIQTILRNYNAPLMTFKSDEEEITQEILMLSLCNGRREGGGFLTSPEAQPNDGILDYAMFSRVSRPMMFRLIPEVMKGTHARFEAVRMGKFRRLELTSEEPFPVHVDGEIFAGFRSEVRRLEIEIMPGALQTIV